MTGVVVDASVALAWGFPDEGNAYADGVLDGLEGQALVVPELWVLEIVNALLVGERRKRIRQAQVRRFLTLLDGLNVVENHQAVGNALHGLLPLGREHGLSAYNAAYLDLAIREGLPLATLDESLRKAAKTAGVAIFRE